MSVAVQKCCQKNFTKLIDNLKVISRTFRMGQTIYCQKLGSKSAKKERSLLSKACNSIFNVGVQGRSKVQIIGGASANGP